MKVAPWIIACLLLICTSSAFAERPRQLAHTMGEYIAMLSSTSAEGKTQAEIGLSILAATDWDNLNAACADKGIPAAATDQLHVILDREKPRNEARAIIRKKVEEIRAWNDKEALDTYKKFGRGGPKWDADARAGILAYFDGTTEGPDRLAKAIEAGCDDPLVLYCEAGTLQKTRKADADTIRVMYRLALNGFTKSDYPAYRIAACGARYQLTVDAYWAQLLKDKKIVPADVLSENARGWNNSYVLFSKVVQENVPIYCLIELESMLMDNFNPRIRDRVERFDPLDEDLKKAIPNTATLYLIEGDYEIRHAFDAKRAGNVNIDPPGSTKLFDERLAKATEYLSKAYELEPQNWLVSDAMLKVEFSQRKGHDIEQKWFDRSIAANPDNRDAYMWMVSYLSANKSDSAADVSKFGRACYDAGNWYGRIPFMRAVMHGRLEVMSPNASAYLARPEVWSEIQATYGPYLQVVLNDTLEKSVYAMWACKCRQYDVARAQLDALGADVDINAFGSQETLDAWRKYLNHTSARTP